MLFFALLPTFLLAVMAAVEPVRLLELKQELNKNSTLHKMVSLPQLGELELTKRTTSLYYRYGPTYLDPAFADLHFATLNSYNILVTACPGYNIAAAISGFARVNTYLIKVFTKCRLAWHYNAPLALAYVARFFTAIRELQILLRLVSRYPAIMLKCRPTFKTTQTYLNYIINDMRKVGIEFSGPVGAYSKVIDYGFFSYVGLTLGF